MSSEHYSYIGLADWDSQTDRRDEVPEASRNFDGLPEVASKSGCFTAAVAEGIEPSVLDGGHPSGGHDPVYDCANGKFIRADTTQNPNDI